MHMNFQLIWCSVRVLQKSINLPILYQKLKLLIHLLFSSIWSSLAYTLFSNRCKRASRIIAELDIAANGHEINFEAGGSLPQPVKQWGLLDGPKSIYTT